MNRFSKTAFFACCVFIFLTGFLYYPRWKQRETNATISWDVSGYYMYLPATFIYSDLKQCRFFDSILQQYRPTPDFQQAIRQPSGSYVMKYTMGQAILYAPWFFIAHAYALLTGYPADGFSTPYQFCISIGMLLYAMIGLWVLRKILLRFFKDRVVGITLMIVVFATNYLNYATIDGAMVHNTLFMLYALFVYSVLLFCQKPTPALAIATGLLSGLMVLVRPTEIICVSIPLLWNVSTGEDLKYKILWLINHKKIWMLSMAVFTLLIALQLIYWKWSSGHWIYDGYRNEGFDWLRPHMVSGLISYRGGWFTYTPVMLLVIPGFVLLYRRFKKIFFALFLFSLLFLYICFSWKEWWYGASLGQRAIIQAYPLFCFPIAALIDWVTKRKLFACLTAIFITLCVLYNLWLTHQSHRGNLFQAGSMTGAYFWRVIGRFAVSKETLLLLDNEEQVPASLLKNSIPIQISPVTNPDTLDATHQYSTRYSIQIPKTIKWVRTSVIVNTPLKEWDTWKLPQLTMAFYKNAELVKINYVRISRVLSDGERGRVYVDAQVPPQYDRVNAWIWNADGQKILHIDSINVSGFYK